MADGWPKNINNFLTFERVVFLRATTLGRFHIWSFGAIGVKRNCLGSKLRDWHTFLQNWNWAAGEVAECNRVRVDAKMLVQRGQKIASTDATLGYIFAPCIGRADHLPAGDAAPCEQYRRRTRPMVTTRLHNASLGRCHPFPRTRRVRDLWRAAELTRHDNHHILIETAGKVSSMSADTAWSKNGVRYFIPSNTLWFTAWSSQLPTRPHRVPLNDSLFKK
jgi:hypothetical protein